MNTNYTPEQLAALKEKYDEAVYQYYQTGDSIMSDLEFDELKETLEANGFNLSDKDSVESDNVREKLTEDNRMISLKKVQVFSEEMTDRHLYDVLAWLSQYQPTTDQSPVAIGWKLDGVASSLRYDKNGNLYDVVTRGNFSIKAKMLEVAMKYHPIGDPNTEIRCEMIMRKSIFREKYMESGYANPRNLVAGITNDQNINDPRKWDVEFIMTNDGLNPTDCAFSHVDSYTDVVAGKYIKYIKTIGDDIPYVYQEFRNSREIFDFPTDGLVVYIPHVTEFEAIGKYPLNAVAIKFPPTEAVTTVEKIEWNLKKSGEWIPKAILAPVELDGSTVRRSLVFNYGYVKSNKVFPGAKVVIAKNGDIIPYIQRVLEPGDESRMNYPEGIVSGIHLYPADDSTAVARERFIAGCYCLGIKNFGYAWFRGLADWCNNDIMRIFDKSHVNYITLRKLFGGWKKAQEFVNALDTKREITIFRVLRLLQIPNLGPATAMQVARFFSGLSTDFSGLEKSVVNGCIAGEYTPLIESALEKAADYGVTINKLVEDTTNYGATYEMTGSPKAFGFATKSEFEKRISNWKHTKLEKTTTYLVTDDLTSNSAKMNKARKNGTKIITYAQAIELHNK